MGERKPLLTSQDAGKDRDAITSLTKKLERVKRNMSSYKQARRPGRLWVDLEDKHDESRSFYSSISILHGLDFGMPGLVTLLLNLVGQ